MSNRMSIDDAPSALRYLDPEGGFGVALLIVWLALVLGGFWFLFVSSAAPRPDADDPTRAQLTASAQSPADADGLTQ